MVLDLETTKTTQAIEIKSLKRRVKKLEKKRRSRTYKLKWLYKVGLTARVDSSDEESLGEDASKQGRIIDEIDADEGITLVNETTKNQERFNDQEDAEMLFDVADDLRGAEVFLKEVSNVDEVNDASIATTTTATIDDITLAKALMEIKSAKPKADKRKEENSLQLKSIREEEQTTNKSSTKEYHVTELVVESSKEAEAEVTEELKQCLEIIPEDEDDVTIDATPMSSNKMLKIFDREDLKVLWRIVKARFEKIKPVDYMDNLLLHNLKTMFEHRVEDNVDGDVIDLDDSPLELRKEVFRKKFRNHLLEVVRIKEIIIEEYLVEDKKIAKQSMDSSLEKLWYLVDEDDEEETYVFDMNEFLAIQIHNDLSSKSKGTHKSLNSTLDEKYDAIMYDFSLELKFLLASKSHIFVPVYSLDTFEEEYKVESEVFDLLKINVDLFTYDTPLRMIFDEFRRLSSMEDDLFAYELGVLKDSYFLCVEQPYDDLENKDLDIYEPRQCYDEYERMFDEAIILIDNRLKRGNDKEVLTNDELSIIEEENLCEGNMVYFQDYKWYEGLEDGNLKEEALKEKAILKGSLGHKKRKGKNFCSWLKESFRNDHELDYELMLKLEEYWDLDDYLIPNDAPYYIDDEEERFKERRSKLLRIPNKKPPTFKSEKSRS
uniref:Zf-BED domain-containing protein n=1 Tax=Tanacetum cinerariifolium TaxID=118510 RepID=A0A6L2NYC6_TANCI|nr:zf-BED domain-containing protein [Tanacetum cinerariifolium]